MLDLARRNVYVTATVILALAYVGLIQIVDNVGLRMLAALLLTIFATSFWVSWVREAWDIYKSGTFDRDRVAYLGFFMIGFGNSYSSLYSFMWNGFGRPESWSMHPVFPIGHLISAFGFMLVTWVPIQSDATKKKPSALLYVATLIMVMAIGYVLGLSRAEAV